MTICRGQCYETFYSHNLPISPLARVFLPTKLFQPRLTTYASKARDNSNGAPFRFSPHMVGSWPYPQILGEVLPSTNALAYCAHSLITAA